MKGRRRKELGVQAGQCRACDGVRQLRRYESWQARGPLGLLRDPASLQRVSTCLTCGYAVRTAVSA